MKNDYKFYFVLLIPIINAVASNTTNYFSSEIFNSGNLRALIIVIFLIPFILKNYPSIMPSKIILLSVLYILNLTILSGNLITSLSNSLKYSIGVLMFPVGYYYFNTIDKFKQLIKIFIITLIIYITNIIISNMFNLGTSDYASDTFYFGSGSVNITKEIFVLVLFAPLSLLLFPNYRKVLYLLYTIGLIISIIGIKRSVLLSVAASAIVYMFLTNFKGSYIKSIVVGIFLVLSILIIFPSIFETFIVRLNARESQLTLDEENIESEARFNEVLLVLNNWNDKSIYFKLFGSEPFNDRYYYKTLRMLHTDYMIMLNGTGIVGIFFWFYIFFVIFKEKNKYKYLIHSNRLNIEMNAIFTALLFSQLLMSISSTVYAISLRSLIFLYWGATISLFRSQRSINANN